MPFIRLSDNYIDHPKFTALSDGAFRLWHEAMAFCRRHQTDGLIPETSMTQFPTFRKDRLAHLLRPYRDDKNALLQVVPGFGYQVHDYLEWNPSKEEENERRVDSKQRMRSLREERRTKPGIPPPVSTNNVLTDTNVRSGRQVVRSVHVPDRIGLGEEGGSGGGDNPIAVFIRETYPTVYAKCRHGAAFRVSEARDFEVCRDLVATYGERVGLLLEYFLQMPPGKDVLNQPGTPRQFKHMAPTCDSELRKHGR